MLDKDVAYPSIDETGIVSNDAASLDIVSAPGSGQRIRLNHIAFSVIESAIGGGGICQLRDTDGTNIYKFNVDGIKDISIPFGKVGKEIAENKGLQFVVYGAATKQAEVQIALSGYKSFQTKRS